MAGDTPFHIFPYKNWMSDILKIKVVPGLVAHSDVCLTGDQEVAILQLRSSPILSLRLIMKSFLWSFSPIH